MSVKCSQHRLKWPFLTIADIFVTHKEIIEQIISSFRHLNKALPEMQQISRSHALSDCYRTPADNCRVQISSFLHLHCFTEHKPKAELQFQEAIFHYRFSLFKFSFVHINSQGKNNCRNCLWLALQLWILLKFIQSAQFTAADVRTVHRCGSSSNTCDIKINFISQFPACGLRLLRVLCVFTPVQALQGHHQLCVVHAGSSLFRWLWYTTESNVLNMLYN